MMRAFLESGPQAIADLETRSAVSFQHLQNPDYHPSAAGGSDYGRAITAMPFDGRILGPHFAQLRPPRPIYMILGGLMVGRREVPILLRPFSSWSALRRTLSIVIPHLWSRLRHPRGTRLLIGNALIGRFLKSAIAAGVDIRTGTRLVSLIRKNGRVTGAVVADAKGTRTIHASGGVVLATGGIAHDLESRTRWMSDHPHQHSLAFEGNTGDGVRAALAVGGVVNLDLDSPAYWSPASTLKRPDGTETVWIHGHMDRGKPGLIAVNSAGRRFVNEADSYHDFVLAMFRSHREVPSIPAWLICDHRFIRAYGLGLIRPHYARLDPYIRAGYLHRADTLDALARQTGIDPGGLTETVARHNSDCDTGVDTAFGRGSNGLNRFNGDPAVGGSNPNLAPISRAPFYAVAVRPSTIGTTVGLRTDPDCRVLDADHQLIPGLFACGNDMSPVMRGTYPGPGITLGPAVVFAWRAAKRIHSDMKAST
jgi:succinate dehydrogenase/fumarate reductase flavoprotein subunit